MTFPNDSSQECLRAWEAMPWVLQDSATPEQRQWLTDHLAGCAACRGEFAQQQRLRLALSLPADLPIDANVGFQRLLSRLDAPEVPAEPVRTQSRATSWLTRALVASVLLQALGIGILGMKVWPNIAEEPAYRTFSQVSAPVAPGAIRVVPENSMTLTDWNTLLHTLHLQVVGGPNDVGAYTVVPRDASASHAALQRLRGAHGIRLAEPIAGP